MYQLVLPRVTPQGCHGAPHLGGFQTVSTAQGTEETQNLNQREEGVPVSMGTGGAPPPTPITTSPPALQLN